MALLGDRESRLFIDGQLVGGSGGTFPNANPATEEVLGVAANADAADMGSAIGAARRAFDETDWSTNVELRVRCIRQLQHAMRDHIEELRDITVSEVGAPVMLTAGAQLEGPVEDLTSPPTRPSPHVERGSRSCEAAGHLHEPHDGARGRRCGRRDHAVEFSAPDQPGQGRSRPWRRETPWCSSPPRTPRGRPPCSAN